MKIELLEAYGVDEKILTAWNHAGHEALLPIQAQAVRKGKVLDGGNVVVFSPTSSGKTFIGEMAAVKAAMEDRRAVYLVPQKALAEEKYLEFEEKYGALGVKTAISTRERKDFDREIQRGEFHVAVVVFEKMQSLMVATPDLLRNVGLVVVDELQMMSDPERGAELEMLITKILHSQAKPQMVGLSAVLGNARDIADWMGATLCEETKRPVELRRGVAFGGEFHYVEENGGGEGVETFGPPAREGYDEDLAGTIVAYARDLADRGEQSILFCRSRRDSMQTAERMAQEFSGDPAAVSIASLRALEASQGRDLLLKLLESGVAYHNAGLDRDQRRVIESGFRKGEIRILCATTTLAMGVNLPSRNVFIDTRRWERQESGRWVTEAISQAEYENIGGRAGRLGWEDDFGRSVIVAPGAFDAAIARDYYVKGELGNLLPMLGGDALDRHALDLVASGLADSRCRVKELLVSSYTGKQYWRESREKKRFERDLADGITRCVSGGLLLEKENGGLQPTRLGRITATRGLQVNTALSMGTFLEKHAHCAEALHPLEILWHLAGTVDGQAVYFNLSSDEKAHAYYPRMLRAALKKVPEEVRTRLSGAMEGSWSDYERLKGLKKTLLLYYWVMAVPTHRLESRFCTYSGNIASLASDFHWLAESMAAMAPAVGWSKAASRNLACLPPRILHGVPQEGVELASLGVHGLGRGRIGLLVGQGMTSIESVVAASVEDLSPWTTGPVAQRLREAAAREMEPKAAREETGLEDPESELEDATLGPEESAARINGNAVEPVNEVESALPEDPVTIESRASFRLHFDGRCRRRRYLLKVNDQDVWLTWQMFGTALRLAMAAKTTGEGLVPCDAIGTFDNYHQIIRRLRDGFSNSGLEGYDLILNDEAKNYRIAAAPKDIHIEESVLEQFPFAREPLTPLAQRQ